MYVRAHACVHKLLGLANAAFSVSGEDASVDAQCGAPFPLEATIQLSQTADNTAQRAL